MAKKQGTRTTTFMESLDDVGDQLEPPSSGPVCEDDGTSHRTPGSNRLNRRIQVISDGLKGDRELTHYSHDAVRLNPQHCVPWPYHDRDLEQLNEATCSDLISGFLEAGRQTTLALVRPIGEVEGVFRYEIIAGLRRWWVCGHLNWQFEAEIRDMDDDEAFRLSDVENRSRKDISDWERAWKYKRALTEIYSDDAVAAGRSSQGHTAETLAQALGKSAAWMSYLLGLTELPEEVVAAYQSPHDILINHGRRLLPLLKQEGTRERILKRASALAEQPTRLDGQAVVRALEQAAADTSNSTKPSPPLCVYTGSRGDGAVILRKKGRWGLVLELDRRRVEGPEEAARIIQGALAAHYTESDD